MVLYIGDEVYVEETDYVVVGEGFSDGKSCLFLEDFDGGLLKIKRSELDALVADQTT